MTGPARAQRVSPVDAGALDGRLREFLKAAAEISETSAAETQRHVDRAVERLLARLDVLIDLLEALHDKVLRVETRLALLTLYEAPEEPPIPPRRCGSRPHRSGPGPVGGGSRRPRPDGR